MSPMFPALALGMAVFRSGVSILAMSCPKFPRNGGDTKMISAQGILNDTSYTSPLPWIGLYIASASTACAIAMASDLIHACRNRNFWFPTKLFSMNATSLTVTTVAVKLSVDLNTPMPSRVDQLSKLSSGVLVCVAIANSMSSLGTVKNKEIMMNVITFVILVVAVFVNVAIQFISIICISRKLKKLLLSSNDSISEGNKIDLRRFVLHLEGKEDLVEVTMRKSCNATDHWMQRGANRQPKHLTGLLRKATFDEGFKGVREFDCNQVPSLEGEEPSQCWSLPVVTLTAIAVALPDLEIRLVKHLLHSVHEGIMYVKLIEDNEEDRKQDHTTKARRAAYRVWSRIDIYHKWFDIDLLHTKGTREILQYLAEAGKNMFADCRKKNTRPTWCPKDYTTKWNAKGIVANSMYRVSSTILLNRYNDADSGERLFRAVEVMISDLLAACLTNLRPVIFCKCLKSTIEERKVKGKQYTSLARRKR
ncbi:hypothetical protein LINPERHAP1_LOCUS36717 [Linum perenne]